MWVYLVDAADGITPETGEAGGQPQLSVNGGAWTNTSATLTAVGNGTYYVQLTTSELSALGRIMVRYKSANTAEFSTVADVVPLLGYAAGTAITLAAPVLESGDVELVQGDDYANADGRALSWSSTSWPDLTGATIAFNVGDGDLVVAGTVVSSGGATQTVRAEPTAAQTATLAATGRPTRTPHRYDVTATLDGGGEVTLARGALYVHDSERS